MDVTEMPCCFSLKVFRDCLSTVAPSMAKFHCCSLWLNQAYIGGLPSFATRHNSPARPHMLTALLNSMMGSGQDGCVLVSTVKGLSITRMDGQIMPDKGV